MLQPKAITLLMVQQDPSIAGDANLDGVFDEQDIMQVLAAGKYKTGEAVSWERGDWNQDGVFDSADLLAAFVVGKYRAQIVSNEHSAHHRDDVPKNNQPDNVPRGQGQPEGTPPVITPVVDAPPVDGKPDARPPADPPFNRRPNP